ncbi:hypothetical protein MMC13_008198 [Lambiella insularis]|nr:hypothetical protein [Lambiella insularis]
MDPANTSSSTLPDKRLSVLKRLQQKMTFAPGREGSPDVETEAAELLFDFQRALRGCDSPGDYSQLGQTLGRTVTSKSSISRSGLSRFFHVNRSRPEPTNFPQLDKLAPETRNLHTSDGERENNEGEMDSWFSGGCRPFWLPRDTSTMFGRYRKRRLSGSVVSSIPNTPAFTPFIDPRTSPVNEAPSIISLNPAGGAAARAAAAAQNEMLESIRSPTPRDKSRLVEPKITNDSESGIGIELREPLDDMDFTLHMTRIDPSLILPEELMNYIMSNLDAVSLMNAELVSRSWHSTASSCHAWRHVFWREHGSGEASTLRAGGMGLGKRRPDQDWKQMWKVRKGLQLRWMQARAAAIYLEGHRDSVYCVQFDENKILTGSRDRTIRVWDARTYECIKVLGVPKHGPSHPHGPRSTLTGRRQKPMVQIVPPWPQAGPTPTAIPPLYHDGSILCLQFDEDIMVTGSSDNTCIMWDIKDDYNPFRRLQHHEAGVLDVCFDDKHIVSCSKDTAVCLWDRRTGGLLRTLTGHRGPVNAVQLRGDLIVSASGDGIAKLWNLKSGLCIKEFPSKDRGMACVEFSPDSRTILAGGNDQVIYHFDANSGELVRELEGHKGLVRSLYLDSANGRVISGSYDASVKAYDLATGTMLCNFEGWTTSWMLSAKADYRRIVATSQDARAVIMDFGYDLPGIELLEA